MLDNYLIFAIFELLIFCIVLYLIIRANIYVNTLQKEVNELHMELPIAIREIKEEAKQFNIYITKQAEKMTLTQQDVGFIVGKIFAELVLLRFTYKPLKGKMLLTSFLFKIWNIRKRLQASFLGALTK